jgi:hypothetical protein
MKELIINLIVGGESIVKEFAERSYDELKKS